MMTNKDKRQLTIIIGIVFIFVNITFGSSAVLDPEDRDGLTVFLVAFNAGLLALIGLFLLASKMFPPSKDNQ